MSDLFSEVFNCLPLAHCINNKILVCSAYIVSLCIIYMCVCDNTHDDNNNDTMYCMNVSAYWIIYEQKTNFKV